MSEYINKNKAFRFTVDIVKKAGQIDGKFFVEGYASTSDLDRQGDIISPGALEQAAKGLKEVNSTVFFGHEYDLGNSVGKIVDASVDMIGLKVKIFVSSWAKELRTKLNEGVISKFSIGGRVLQDHVISREIAIEQGLMSPDDPFNFITIIDEIELFEVSFVGVPANPHAMVSHTLAKALHEIHEDKKKEGGDKMSEKDIKQVEPKEEIVEKAEPTHKCTDCDWKGSETDLKEGKCPTCEKDVALIEEKKEEVKEEVKEVVEEKVEEVVEEEKADDLGQVADSPETGATLPKPIAEEKVVEEITEEEVKEIVEEEELEEKKVSDMESKITALEVEVKDLKAMILKGIEDFKQLIQDKVKTIVEVTSEKKSIIKKDNPEPEAMVAKEITGDDLDGEFLKRIKR